MLDHCEFQLLALAAMPLCVFCLNEPLLAQSFGMFQMASPSQPFNGPVPLATPLFATGMNSAETESQTQSNSIKITPLMSTEAASDPVSTERMSRLPLAAQFSSNPAFSSSLVSSPLSTQPDPGRALSAKPEVGANPTQNNLFGQIISNSAPTGASEGGHALWNADNTLYKLDQVGACVVNRQSTATRTCR